MALPTLARRVITLGVPLVLGLIELGHPALMPGDDIVARCSRSRRGGRRCTSRRSRCSRCWDAQCGALARELDGQAARIARGARAIFIAIYPAFDAAVALASGLLMQALGAPPATTRAAVEPFLQALFWGPVTGTLALIASLSWLIALGAAALAWRRARAPLAVVGLLALAGLLLAIAHIRPFGPLACLAFLLASGWVELGRSSAARA